MTCNPGLEPDETVAAAPTVTQCRESNHRVYGLPPVKPGGSVLSFLIVHQQVKFLSPEWSIIKSFSYYPHRLHPAPWFWLESSGGRDCTIHGEEFWEFSSESNSILTTAVLQVHSLSHLDDCQGRVAALLALRTFFFQQIFAIAIFLKTSCLIKVMPGVIFKFQSMAERSSCLALLNPQGTWRSQTEGSFRHPIAPQEVRGNVLFKIYVNSTFLTYQIDKSLLTLTLFNQKNGPKLRML